MNSRIAAIILAAGRSERMKGRNKLLLRYRGKPILLYPVEAAHDAGADPCLVVTGYQAEKINAVLPPYARPVYNADHHLGMGTSISCGVRALPPRSEGALIIQGDMPLLTAEIIRKIMNMVKADRGPQIIVPYAHHRQGNPVYFSKHFFAELQRLHRDRGAKELLQHAGEALCRLHLDDPAVLTDVDDMEAYQQLMNTDKGT